MRLEASLRRLAERHAGTLPLRIRLWNGSQFDLDPAPRVTLAFPTPQAASLLLRPDLETLAAAYVEGRVEVEGSLPDILQVAQVFNGAARPAPWFRWRRHTKRADAEAIRYHYDVSNDFYRLWLDRRMVYSCAYFKRGDEDIHQAQEQKLDHLCRKLMLSPGERFLDIGCGWGGLILWAAKHYGVSATGITLSRNQFEVAQERIRQEGLEGRCQVRLMDYRDLTGEFDKIASVGMFEHVGIANLPRYFATASRLLREGGLMLNHGITQPESSGKGLDAGDFIGRYVFPMGELPELSRVIRDMARQDLEVADVECLRPHYAQTLMHWVDRLESSREAAEALVGAQRYRIWRIYMAGCAQSFEQGGVSIYQVLASKQRRSGLSPLPWTREHLYGSSRAPATELRWPPGISRPQV
jgi:cyclopropane-fatty-acyl-phospholipid synthase